MKSDIWTFFGLASLLFLSACGETVPPQQQRPNILLIVADDLGYSDLGSFGSEISTPNLDALAAGGQRFTSFYVTPNCSPTRAMLMSGTDPHLAGLGAMAEIEIPERKPGFEGYLNKRVATIAELLQAYGYSTSMAGKWHLGSDDDKLPSARGFDRTFAQLQGSGHHFANDPIGPDEPHVDFRENGRVVGVPEDYYSSETFADKTILAIEASGNRPFFAYLAFTAPHWPLQAPDEFLEKQRGKYDEGYSKIREQRLARMKELGIIAPDTQPFPQLPMIPDWTSLPPEDQEQFARKMELYAAMVEALDSQVGKVLSYLDSAGELDNTLIVFMSDNGAAAEHPQLWTGQPEWYDEEFDNSLTNMGRRGSFITYGAAWAQVGATPFRLFKTTTAEGGVRAPMIVKMPAVSQQASGAIVDTVATAMDISPTILDLAGVAYPERFAGNPLLPQRGRSLLSILEGGRPASNDSWYAAELWGHRMVRKGDWKALSLQQPFGSGDWQLYDLAADPAELIDLSAANPQKLAELQAEWADYASAVGLDATELKTDE